jgi:hypothetical protein
MIPCSGCKRHLHEADRVCPFCATEQRVAPSPSASPGRGSVGAFVLAAAIMLGANACAKDSVPLGAETSGGSSDSSETGGDTTTATESSESDSTGSTEGDTFDSAGDTFDTSLSFYAGPDNDVAFIGDCDPFAQDCPEGEKCVAYSSTGGSWDANKCVPVVGSGSPGDPCLSGGAVEGSDDCGPDSYCWDVMDVDGMSVGVCTEFCSGTPDDPLCPAQTSCLIANEGSITLCVPTCDPLLQDCSAGLACYWATNDFNCIFTSGDIPLGEPCGFINDCVLGTGCLPADVQLGCEGSACCVSFCSLADPICPQEGTECVGFFEEGVTPPQYVDVGVCIIPGA